MSISNQMHYIYDLYNDAYVNCICKFLFSNLPNHLIWSLPYLNIVPMLIKRGTAQIKPKYLAWKTKVRTNMYDGEGLKFNVVWP